MTKKDYVLIAGVINDFIATSTSNNQQVDVEHCKNLIDSMAYRLEQENARFDKQRFVEACIKATTIKASDLR